MIPMMYLLALLLPPVAVLLSGKPFQAIINFFLTLLFWFPGAIHAILVVKDRKDDKRMERQVKLMKSQEHE
jgi:uncharacterized membrane protein YqaE (UPF0057 family)